MRTHKRTRLTVRLGSARVVAGRGRARTLKVTAAFARRLDAATTANVALAVQRGRKVVLTHATQLAGPLRAGRRTLPFRLRLPAGRYRMRLRIAVIRQGLMPTTASRVSFRSLTIR